MANGDSTNQYIIQLTGSTYNLTAAQMLTNTAGVTIEGTGSASSAVIIAAANSRAFQVGLGANVTFANLTIQGGVATNDGLNDGALTALGGGILDLGGNVALNSVAVQNNIARGGAAGTTTVSGEGTGGGDAAGGGVYVSNGSLTLINSTVSGNTAQGGLGGNGANRPHRSGGGGASGGSAFGGGVAGSGATIDILNSSITGNSATGGAGGAGGNPLPTEGPGYGGGAGGYGGFAEGGGVANRGGTVQMINSTVATNTVVGGNGGTGGKGGSGNPGGPGGPGGAGGEGLGGGIYEAGSSSVYLNITVTQNSAAGGLSGTTGPAGGSAGTTTATTGGPQPPVAAFAAGGGVYVSSASSPTLTNTLLENNTAPNGPDYFGPVNPNASNNFVSNDSGATTFNSATNILNNSTPQLGAATIGPNGTTYYPLLAGSQSINAGTNDALSTIAAAEGVPQSQATDQIGNPRLVGPFIDIGAIEYPIQATTTTVNNVQGTFNPADQTFTLTAQVVSADGTIVNEGTVTFTVEDANGNPIGSPVAAPVTNGQASATYTLPGGTPVGTYTIVANYDDSSVGNYQNSSGTGTLTVSAAPTNTSVSNVTASYSPVDQTITLGATVTSGEVPVNEGQVTFVVTNSTGQVIGSVTANVSNGTATASFMVLGGLPPGTYTITATYNDSTGNYQGGSGTGTLTIVAAPPPSISVGNASAPYTNEDPTITLSATVISNGIPVNEGQVQFVIAGLTPQPITAQVVNGQATATFGVPPNTPLGNYTITATYSTPSGDFQTSSGTGTLNIFASPTTVTINNVNIVYGLFSRARNPDCRGTQRSRRGGQRRIRHLHRRRSDGDRSHRQRSGHGYAEHSADEREPVRQHDQPGVRRFQRKLSGQQQPVPPPTIAHGVPHPDTHSERDYGGKLQPDLRAVRNHFPGSP